MLGFDKQSGGDVDVMSDSGEGTILTHYFPEVSFEIAEAAILDNALSLVGSVNAS